METAQKLVDEAAAEAGYNIKVYHGTANGGQFTIFDPAKLNNSTLSSHIGQDFYFTNSKSGAKEYTSNMDAYGRLTPGKNTVNVFSEEELDEKKQCAKSARCKRRQTRGFLQP